MVIRASRWRFRVSAVRANLPFLMKFLYFDLLVLMISLACLTVCFVLPRNKFFSFADTFYTVVVCFACVPLFLYGMQVSSNSPHHVRRYIGGGPVLLDEMTTNNLDVETQGALVIQPDGTSKVSVVFVTNSLWTKYTFFK